MKETTTRKESLRRQIGGLLPRLRNFARSLTADPDRADDLVQETCERALNRLDQVRDASRLDSWLYRIAYTRWIDHLRRRSNRSANLIVLTNEKPAFNPTEDNGAGLAGIMDIQKALGALSAEHRAAITLVCVEGYSYAQAAEVLNVAPGTMASRVARARAQLACHLSSTHPRVQSVSGVEKRKQGK